ncbi:SprT-like domain-containing protein [Flavobacterium lacus]|uniref:Uncharacterized protein n=1 Tax=Flavobacterium lacus TaxID=1353778 RepID=A0A328X6T4_9FLAO|nr:SprT-like domain-containing protein [Flavobacterium lacus]RAR51048.1 hypothetical protein B0I10_101221 [Flavobacterium lacus]
MKKIHVFITVFLLVVVPLLFLNCSSEEDFVTGTHFSPHNKKFTFSDFKKETGLKNFSFVKKARLNTSIHARDIDSDFLIDTLEIKRHINPSNDKTTYSFKLYPISEQLESKEYYNLVFEKIGEEWNELIFFNKEKINPIEGEPKLESSEMVYNRMSLALSQGYSEIITYNFHCTGTGKCSTGTCDECHLCISETVTYVYTGINHHDPGSGSLPGSSDPGSGGNSSGIYIPNPYDGAEDLNNLGFMLAGDVVAYFNTLPNTIQSLTISYPWIFNYLIDYFSNNGGVNPISEQNATIALTTFQTLTQNFNSPNWLTTSNEQINFWAFYTLLNNTNQRGFNPQDLFEIKDYLLSANPQTAESIIDYLFSNFNDTESMEFVLDFLRNVEESGLNLDFEKTLNSPANIDDSAIDKSTPEGQKFDCIYKKLMESPSFKNLFVNTFGGEQTKLNVKFEIAENLPNTTNGNCLLLPASNGNYTNLIRINKNILAGPNVRSNFKIAKTILHECIHAYLNIKKINCNLGSTITELNGLDLQQLIGTFYQSFGCHISVNGSPQSQHEFMFNHLVPTFQNIFSEIRDLLAPQSNIDYVNNNTYLNTINNQNFTWNWNDFYKYFSLEGLHLCESFVQNITQVPVENFYYDFYRSQAQQFSKDCQ